MARRLIVDEWVSADGLAARLDDSIDFFTDATYPAELIADVETLVANVDTILLGATTYRLFAGYWPQKTRADDPLADAINAARKIVFSRSLTEAPWGRFEPARIVAGDLESQVRQIKKEPGKDLIVWGSLTIAAGLLKAGLVDRIILRVCPVAIGRGKTLFPRDVNALPLRLVSSRRYAPGVLLNEYVPD